MGWTSLTWLNFSRGMCIILQLLLLCSSYWTYLLNQYNLDISSGLLNDSIPETFSLTHKKEGYEMPCRYLKIVPLLSWGPSFNFSIWFVELQGEDDASLVKESVQFFHDVGFNLFLLNMPLILTGIISLKRERRSEFVWSISDREDKTLQEFTRPWEPARALHLKTNDFRIFTTLWCSKQTMQPRKNLWPTQCKVIFLYFFIVDFSLLLFWIQMVFWTSILVGRIMRLIGNESCCRHLREMKI